MNLIHMDKGVIIDIVDNNLLDLLRKKLGISKDSFILLNVLVYNTHDSHDYGK